MANFHWNENLVYNNRVNDYTYYRPISDNEEMIFYNQKVKEEFTLRYKAVSSSYEEEIKEIKAPVLINGNKDYLIALKDAIESALDNNGSGIGKY